MSQVDFLVSYQVSGEPDLIEEARSVLLALLLDRDTVFKHLTVEVCQPDS